MLIKIDASDTSIAKRNVGASSSHNLPLTPHSPITPTPIKVSPRDPTDPITANEPYSVESVLKQQGHVPLSRLAKTLQGSIWKVSATERPNHGSTSNDSNDSNESDDTYIIKVTSKALHNQHIAYIDEKPYSIQENIVKEAGILRYLTLCGNQPPPESLVQYLHCFCDSHNYFLVMEDGGSSLFHFIKECHALIKNRTISIQQWRKFCHNAMKQMADVMHWLHSDMKVCHLDVSLENFTIKNMKSTVVMHRNADGLLIPTMELGSDFQIKVIDFGVAKVFTSKNVDGTIDFRCKKYVGKTGYKAPEVYSKKHSFDARSADCWSLGVCFFMMFFGCGPYEKPSTKDLLFTLIMNGQLVDILDNWGILEYATPEICDLLLRLFVPEKFRLSMAEIKRHCWLNAQTQDI